jgi:hypothetical protein
VKYSFLIDLAFSDWRIDRISNKNLILPMHEDYIFNESFYKNYLKGIDEVENLRGYWLQKE